MKYLRLKCPREFRSKKQRKKPTENLHREREGSANEQ